MALTDGSEQRPYREKVIKVSYEVIHWQLLAHQPAGF